jgi:hypothetical protein
MVKTNEISSLDRNSGSVSLLVPYDEGGYRPAS